MSLPQIYDLENGNGSVIRFQVETLNNAVYMYCPQNSQPTLCPVSVNEARTHWEKLISQGWRVKESENV